MNSTSQAYRKPFTFGPLLRLSLVGGICGVIGLAHIYGKNRQASMRSEMAEMRDELSSVEQEIILRKQQIAELLERENLENSLERGRSELRPIRVGTVIPIPSAAMVDRSENIAAPKKSYTSAPYGKQSHEVAIMATEGGLR